MSSYPVDPILAPSSEPEPTAEEEESWLMPGAWLLNLLSEITLGPHQPLSTEEPPVGDAPST